MPAFQHTPVAVFTYKKADALKEVLKAVNAYKPARLYVVMDKSTENDREDVVAVRTLLNEFEFATIPEFIEPPQHQGILNIFDHALDHIFGKEERLIILEDDTVPSPLFFDYCNVMLEKYKDDAAIGCINGANLHAVNNVETFFTSRVSLPFWGWATWAGRWRGKPKGWAFWDEYKTKDHAENKGDSGINRLVALFDHVRQYPKSWDTQWAMYLLYSNQRTILPGANLVTNKGYTDKATFAHILNSKYANQNSFEEPFEKSFFNQETGAEKKYIDEVVKCVEEFRNRIVS
ncbi:MAG: hypothetical protein V4658_13840 [Bacteroidota bacterium]